MSNIKITLADGNLEEDASQRYIDAWHRAERGETFHERRLAFEGWESLARLFDADAARTAFCLPPQRLKNICKCCILQQ